MALTKKTTQNVSQLKTTDRQLVALREFSKITRRSLTDAILAFTEYVDGVGKYSTCPERAYSNTTRTIYAAFGLNKLQRNALEEGRSVFDIRQLNFIMEAEARVAEVLWGGIEAGVERAVIKAMIKNVCADVASYFEASNQAAFPKQEAS